MATFLSWHQCTNIRNDLYFYLIAHNAVDLFLNLLLTLWVHGQEIKEPRESICCCVVTREEEYKSLGQYLDFAQSWNLSMLLYIGMCCRHKLQWHVASTFGRHNNPSQMCHTDKMQRLIIPFTTASYVAVDDLNIHQFNIGAWMINYIHRFHGLLFLTRGHLCFKFNYAIEAE